MSDDLARTRGMGGLIPSTTSITTSGDQLQDLLTGSDDKTPTSPGSSSHSKGNPHERRVSGRGQARLVASHPPESQPLGLPPQTTSPTQHATSCSTGFHTYMGPMETSVGMARPTRDLTSGRRPGRSGGNFSNGKGRIRDAQWVPDEAYPRIHGRQMDQDLTHRVSDERVPDEADPRCTVTPTPATGLLT